MPSRGSAAPSDCGAGGGGAGSGQMAGTHASNWTTLAHRAAEIVRRAYEFIVENAEFTEEYARTTYCTTTRRGRVICCDEGK